MADPTPDEVIRILGGDHTVDAEALTIVMDLAATDPHAFDLTTGQGVRCVLCDATPPGAALTLATTQHREYCTWRRAYEYSRRLNDILAKIMDEGTDDGS